MDLLFRPEQTWIWIVAALGSLAMGWLIGRATVASRSWGRDPLGAIMAATVQRRSRRETLGHLLEAVWGRNPSLATRTVDTHISRVRSKLQALFESAVPLYSAKPEDVRQQVAAFHYYGVKADFGKDGQALVLLEVVERTNGDFFDSMNT